MLYLLNKFTKKFLPYYNFLIMQSQNILLFKYIAPMCDVFNFLDAMSH